jgi:large subunit ribosomal protein L18
MKRSENIRMVALRRARRTRRILAMRGSAPRLSVFRSNRYLAVQIIDDVNGATLAAASDRELKKGKTAGSRMERASAVGALIAERAKAKGITHVRFDRGRYRYHGLVAALAGGAREAGLTF